MQAAGVEIQCLCIATLYVYVPHLVIVMHKRYYLDEALPGVVLWLLMVGWLWCCAQLEVNVVPM
jgi:hypothetical protein